MVSLCSAVDLPARRYSCVEPCNSATHFSLAAKLFVAFAVGVNYGCGFHFTNEDGYAFCLSLTLADCMSFFRHYVPTSVCQSMAGSRNANVGCSFGYLSETDPSGCNYDGSRCGSAGQRKS